MQNKVNISQVSLLLLLVITGGKFLTLPSVLAKEVGHDSWLVVTVAFFWDAICLCFLLWAIRLNKQRLSFDEILNKTVSKVVCKLVLLVFFVIFMCRVLVLMDSCYNAFAGTFDININWIFFLLPIVLVSGFAISRGFNSIARTGQILFGLIIVAIVALLVYPTTQTKWASLLPFGEVGFGKILQTAFLKSFWFSDYIFIYFVLEDLKPTKHSFAPVLTCFAVGAVLVVLFNSVFVAIFGELAPQTDLAMSKIGMFSVADSTDGRWDWLTLSVWLISVILKIIIFTFCAYKCVEKFFDLHLQKINLFVLGALAILLLLPLFMPITTLLETFVSWCVVPFAVVQYLLPLVLPLLTKLAHRGNETLELANEQS